MAKVCGDEQRERTRAFTELTSHYLFGASWEDIARTTHAHPTLPEAIREAALAVEGRALHI